MVEGTRAHYMEFSDIDHAISFSRAVGYITGMLAGTVQLATRKQAAKLGNSVRGTCTLLMTLVTSEVRGAKDNSDSSLLLELQQLLSQFAKVFELPTELPFVRA